VGHSHRAVIQLPSPDYKKSKYAGFVWHRTSWLVLLAALMSLSVVACASDGDDPVDAATPQPGATAGATASGVTSTPDANSNAGSSASTARPTTGVDPDPTADPNSDPVPTPSTPGRGATPVPTQSTGTGSQPDPTPEGKAGDLARIGELVSGIRELSAGGNPNVSLVDKQRIAEELAEDFADPDVLAEIADLDVLLKLQGLIPQDSSLMEIEQALLEGAVVGLYNHETGELLVLVSGEEVSVKEEAVYSHEYAHLIQDANFDLSVLYEDAKGDSEREGALQALVEGEATFIETIYGARTFLAEDLGELLAIDPADLEVLLATPDFLLASISWPYTAGFGFVNSIWQQGGMSALNDVWGDLPETTEQVIHPEKYLTDEYPEAPPALPDMAAILGDGWSVQDDDVLGEAYISLWLEALGTETAVAAQAAAGWGRDGYQLLDGPGDRTAMGLLIEWDDPDTDALQFSAAFEAVLDADAAFTRLEGDDMTIARWDGPGGILAFALDGATGAAGVAVAPSVDEATALLDALVDG